VFVSNALSGTVTRFSLDNVGPNNVHVASVTQIASGYTHRCDPAAFVVAPTGLAYDAKKEILYVASTADNAVFAVINADKAGTTSGPGTLIYHDNKHLHGPLALTLAPNGHLVTSNADVINSNPKRPSEIVEFTKTGKFVAQFPIDPNQGGSFGLAFAPKFDDFVRFAAVNDNALTLSVWELPIEESTNENQ
jgi:DNA-binding beta-propeller fold protein YncE